MTHLKQHARIRGLARCRNIKVGADKNGWPALVNQLFHAITGTLKGAGGLRIQRGSFRFAA
jgi:hypothetical protein